MGCEFQLSDRYFQLSRAVGQSLMSIPGLDHSLHRNGVFYLLSCWKYKVVRTIPHVYLVAIPGGNSFRLSLHTEFTRQPHDTCKHTVPIQEYLCNYIIHVQVILSDHAAPRYALICYSKSNPIFINIVHKLQAKGIILIIIIIYYLIWRSLQPHSYQRHQTNYYIGTPVHINTFSTPQ